MPSKDSNVIGFIFLGLAVITTLVALHPGWKGGFRWGRTATAVPMSALGLCAWVVAFLLISAAGFGWLPLLTIFGVPPLLAAAGLYDSHRASRKPSGKTAPPPRRPDL